MTAHSTYEWRWRHLNNAGGEARRFSGAWPYWIALPMDQLRWSQTIWLSRDPIDCRGERQIPIFSRDFGLLDVTKEQAGRDALTAAAPLEGVPRKGATLGTKHPLFGRVPPLVPPTLIESNGGVPED